MQVRTLPPATLRSRGANVTADIAIDIQEVPEEDHRACCELAALRSVGHSDGCACRSCASRRESLLDQLDFVDRYPRRFGTAAQLVSLMKCEHDISIYNPCYVCETLDQSRKARGAV